MMCYVFADVPLLLLMILEPGTSIRKWNTSNEPLVWENHGSNSTKYSTQHCIFYLISSIQIYVRTQAGQGMQSVILQCILEAWFTAIAKRQNRVSAEFSHRSAFANSRLEAKWEWAAPEGCARAQCAHRPRFAGLQRQNCYKNRFGIVHNNVIEMLKAGCSKRYGIQRGRRYV